jgi:hypothetical protein
MSRDRLTTAIVRATNLIPDETLSLAKEPRQRHESHPGRNAVARKRAAQRRSALCGPAAGPVEV